MKIWKSVILFFISFAIVTSFFVLSIIQYSRQLNKNIFAIASNNLESTYDAIEDLFSRYIKDKGNDLRTIDTYLQQEENEESIQQFLYNITQKESIDNFFFVNDSKYYDVDCNCFDIETKTSLYLLDDGFRYDGNNFYFLIDVEPKIYKDISYNRIAVIQNKDQFLSKLAIKAYKKECNSALIIEDGRILSTFEDDFWGVENVYMLFDKFEMDLADSFKNDLKNVKSKTYELRYKDTFYYLHYKRTPIDGVYVIGLIPTSTMNLDIEGIRNVTAYSLSLFFGIVFFLILIFAFVYYRRKMGAKNKEIELRRILFDTISENLDDIFILLDKKCNPIYVSPNSFRLLGVAPSEIKNNINAMYDRDESNIRPLIYDASTLEIGKSRSVTRKLKNKLTGEIYWCLDSLYHLKKNNTEVYICILSDRSKEKQSYDHVEQALDLAIQANNAKTSFLANMSHDLRTPMNAILGFSNLLIEEKDQKRIEEYAIKINNSSKLLLELINDILDMSKIEAGKQTLNLSNVEIAALIRNVEIIIKPLAIKKNIKFEVYMDSIIHPFIKADKLKLVQVLTNILSNSIKYTQEFGKVEFRIKENSPVSSHIGKYEFTIKDNGIGMSKEFIDDIFVPFARENNKVKNIQGTGLGMPIAKNIVDLLGGTINVDSEEGKGSIFTIHLDFEFSKEESIKDVHSKKREYDLSGKRILVVEDNEVNILLIKEILKKSKAQFDIATNGEEAVRMASNDVKYDCILMDVVMPIMNGYEVTRRIRASSNQYLKDIPIVAMTANAFLSDIENARKAGMNCHISKPIDFNRLLELLTDLLKK